ncbi:MAG: oxalate:formate antiporter [Deltaproteobacteria bacterium]|nr:oxalate:formate antiporter [Deltaproteobacteria bacterium]
MDRVPEPHASFLAAALAQLQADPRLVGVAGAGSLVTGGMDAYSDLDLIIAVEPAAVAAVMAEREAIARSLGPLLAAFTGEHVGEPRLIIALYGPDPLLHVDLKFVALDDVATRVEDPRILWERDGRLTAALGAGQARFPAPDLQWIEDRFWIWVHYGAGKIGRGELFEALDFLGFLRGQVLGPLALQQVGARPAGVRRLETAAPAFAARLQATLAEHDARAIGQALTVAVELYRELRAALRTAALRTGDAAEAAATAYLAAIVASR